MIKTKEKGKKGIAAIDQIRTVDKRRLAKHIDTLNAKTSKKLLEALSKMFTI